MPRGDNSAIKIEPNCSVEQIRQDVILARQVAETPPLKDLKDPQEIRERLQWYIDLMISCGKRPGLQGAISALHISRQAFWTWAHEDGERGRIVREFKQLCANLIENWGIEGHLSPPVAIFWAKNFCGMRDVVELEAVDSRTPRPEKTPEEIAKMIEQDIPLEADTVEL